MYQDDHMGWMGGWMGIWWLPVISALVGLIIWVLARSATPSTARRETAEDILERRYANGEIGHETYERLLIQIKESAQQRHAS